MLIFVIISTLYAKRLRIFVWKPQNELHHCIYDEKLCEKLVLHLKIDGKLGELCHFEDKQSKNLGIYSFNSCPNSSERVVHLTSLADLYGLGRHVPPTQKLK